MVPRSNHLNEQFTTCLNSGSLGGSRNESPPFSHNRNPFVKRLVRQLVLMRSTCCKGGLAIYLPLRAPQFFFQVGGPKVVISGSVPRVYATSGLLLTWYDPSGCSCSLCLVSSLCTGGGFEAPKSAFQSIATQGRLSMHSARWNSDDSWRFLVPLIDELGCSCYAALEVFLRPIGTCRGPFDTLTRQINVQA